MHRARQDSERWADAILPADAEATPIETGTSRRPIMALVVVVGLGLALLVVQLFRLQIEQGSRNLNLANGNSISQTITSAPRGVIYDRNHQLLVRNVASLDITVTPELVPRSASARKQELAKVADLAGITTAVIEAKLADRSLNPLQPQLLASNLDRTKALLLDQEINDLPGFSLQVNPIRDYLDNGLDANILGYTGRVSATDLVGHPGYLPTDYIGKAGLERQYDSALKGQDGRQQTEVDSAGRPVRVLASAPATPGSSLVLTIDQGLQQKLTQALEAELAKSGTKRAAGVAIDPKTGEILALVSIPGYNENLFSQGISAAAYQQLTSDAAQPLFNKPVSGAYPTGSIIKPLVASAALEEGTITPATTVDDKGSLQVPNPYNPSITYTYHGWEPGGLGVMNLERAIAMSSDIYFYTVGGGFGNVVGLGVNRLTSWYEKFGLGKPTGIDLPGEAAGRVPTPAWKEKTEHQPWYLGDTFNISVGQGDILASPLQMAVATAAVANGGSVMQPHLVKEVIDNNGQVTKTIEPVVERKLAIDPSYLQVVRDGMRQTITSGTGCCYIQQFISVPVAGKTGTAETDPGGNRKPDAWFTSFAPYGDPNIVVVALLENAGEGANFAAPAVRDTLAWYFSPH